MSRLGQFPKGTQRTLRVWQSKQIRDPLPNGARPTVAIRLANPATNCGTSMPGITSLRTTAKQRQLRQLSSGQMLRNVEYFGKREAE
jgi:hypothetical protein